MPPEFVTILGVRFFAGTVEEAVERMERGGLLVVPAAPALKDIDCNTQYREALLSADLCIPDSAFMVMIWNRISKQKIHRLSGLKYLRQLLLRDDAHRPGNVLWIMAGPSSAQRNLGWLKTQGIEVPRECVYLAPMYSNRFAGCIEIWMPISLPRWTRLPPSYRCHRKTQPSVRPSLRR